MTEKDLLATTEEQKVEVLRIAHEMALKGIETELIKKIIILSFEYGGAYDLMCIWDEGDHLALGDLKELIEDVGVK